MTKLEIPPERDFPAGTLVRRKSHLLSEIARMEDDGAVVGGRSPRRWPLLVLAPAALLVLAATALAVMTREPAEIVGGIGCYAAPDVEASTAVVDADGRDPVAACAELWEEGALPSASGDAPPLVACSPPQGEAVWVFPGEPGTCERLGLGSLPSGYETAATRFAGMREEMERRFEAAGCVGEREGRSIARKVLDANGFATWRVQVGGGETGEGFTETERCASLSFDPVAKEVILAPDVPP